MARPLEFVWLDKPGPWPPTRRGVRGVDEGKGTRRVGAQAPAPGLGWEQRQVIPSVPYCGPVKRGQERYNPLDPDMGRPNQLGLVPETGQHTMQRDGVQSTECNATVQLSYFSFCSTRSALLEPGCSLAVAWLYCTRCRIGSRGLSHQLPDPDSLAFLCHEAADCIQHAIWAATRPSNSDCRIA